MVAMVVAVLVVPTRVPLDPLAYPVTREVAQVQHSWPAGKTTADPEDWDFMLLETTHLAPLLIQETLTQAARGTRIILTVRPVGAVVAVPEVGLLLVMPRRTVGPHNLRLVAAVVALR